MKNKNIIIFLIISVIFITIYYDTYRGNGYIKGFINTSFNGVNISSGSSNTINFASENKVNFLALENGFLQCTKDGVKYFNNNKQRWNDTYTMTSPICVSRGNYAAVFELSGRNAIVYNTQGKAYSVNTESPIIKAYVNETGLLALLMNSSDGYLIQIFSSSGSLMISRPEVDKNVYPIDIKISSDNKVFAVSYINTNDIKVISNIVFYYINYNESQNLDGIFAGIDSDPDIFIAIISFMKDDKLIAVSDKSIIAANINGEKIWEYKLTNSLSAISFGKNDIIALAYSDNIIDTIGESKKQGTVELLNLNGKVTGTFDSGGNVTYLKSNKYGTIVGVGKTYTCLNDYGNRIWEHKATRDINDIILIGSSKTALYVTKKEAKIINMPNFRESPIIDDIKDLENTENNEDINTTE